MSIDAALALAKEAMTSADREHVALCIARLQGLLDLAAAGDEARVMATLIPLMNHLDTLR